MLATMPTHQHDLRDHSRLGQANNSYDIPPVAAELLGEERLCPGCKLPAVSENGGLVVAFGQSFFHVDCFKCAKCGDQVTADTNLLLLSDGSPICANCSYSCNVCHQPILDEAIMTGDDSYHAHCFKCKVCKSRIDELVFAKTSQGIYCMNCHNERMIKIRKHAQRKAEREKEKLNGTSGNPTTRSRQENNDANGAQPGRPITPARENTVSSPVSTNSKNSGSRSPAQRQSGPFVSDAFEPGPGSSLYQSRLNSPLSPTFPSLSAPGHDPSSGGFAARSTSPVNQQPITVLSPVQRADSPVNTRPRGVQDKQNTLPIPPHVDRPSEDIGDRRRSYDDGVRPLNVLMKQKNDSLGVSDGLSIPGKTSTREKRRSIMPGFSLPSAYTPSSSRPSTPPNLSPAQLPPHIRTATPPLNGRESPRPSQASRPRSNGSFSSLSGPSTSSSAASSPTVVNRDANSAIDTSAELTPRKPTRPALTADMVPPRMSSLDPDLNQRLQRSPSSAMRSQRPFDDRQGKTPSSRSPSRTRTPSRGADVPKGVETESESDAERNAPQPPPKDQALLSASTDGTSVYLAAAVNGASSSSLNSTASELEVGLESGTEVGDSPVERVSHSTFIAPALPPIRFSMSGPDLSDLLTLSTPAGTPGGAKKSLDHLARLAEGAAGLDAVLSGDDWGTVPQLKMTAASEGHGSAEANALPNGDISQGQITPRPRASSESYRPIRTSNSSGNTTITITEPESIVARPLRTDLAMQSVETAMGQIRGILSGNASEDRLSLDRSFMETVLSAMEKGHKEYTDLKGRADTMKRASKQYIDGISVAQTEYDQELKARREAEAEVTRLRILLSGQAARLTALSGDHKKQEIRQQISQELTDSLAALERDLAKLQVERAMTLAEVEELAASKSSSTAGNGDFSSASLGRSLTMRLDHIKAQYQHELIPLAQQREALSREIVELKSVRDAFLEETTALNVRNEELAQLSAQYARKMESAGITLPSAMAQEKRSASFDRMRLPPGPSPVPSVSSSTVGSAEESYETKYIKIQKPEQEFPTASSKGKFMKWGSSRKDVQPAVVANDARGKAQREHTFQQLSVLRFTRCDHCGDKMWGSQLRCTACNISVHARCLGNVQSSCSQTTIREESPLSPPLPSMFGRDLTEQAQADSKHGERFVPVIVEKCIDAVETLALDLEGIYRKTGGSGQSKLITQLFEKGDYNAFDLRDTDKFNDICSVTSVLKTYFRSLPDPLLTHELHQSFMAAAHQKDAAAKDRAMTELVNKLPQEHYHTLRMLMIHLSHVMDHSEKNLMNARNLGVVFGPTLMRSPDPGAEFADMAGKALSIEWLVENAKRIFS